MTEVPEYLLERSRARRAALGLGGGDAPADSAPAAAAPSGAPVAGGDTPAAGAGAPAASASSAPAPSAAPTTKPAPAEALPTYVDTGPKSGVPVWMMPVLLVLPLWAIIYMGAFAEQSSAGGERTGAQVFAASCVTCHGAQGQGGVGPALAGGEGVKTFPDAAAQIEFVKTGSSAIKGQPYGDPGRPGGQRVAATGGMPAWSGQLTDAEIEAVVAFEREGL